MLKDLYEYREEIHNYIILEMFLKTLERDRQHLTNLKMAPVLDEWYDAKINETFNQLKSTRDFLYKKGCKIEKHKVDDFGTDYLILYRGQTESRRYSNVALRNWVREEMKRILGMEYKRPSDMV